MILRANIVTKLSWESLTSFKGIDAIDDAIAKRVNSADGGGIDIALSFKQEPGIALTGKLTILWKIISIIKMR